MKIVFHFVTKAILTLITNKQLRFECKVLDQKQSSSFGSEL